LKIRLFTITAALLGLNSSQLSAQEEAQPNTISQTPSVSASSSHLQFASSINLALNASPNPTPSPNPSQASDKAVANPRVRLRLSRQLENLDGSEMPSELPTLPEPPLDPGAIQIEGDSIKVYPGRRMLATGNAVMTKDTTKIQGDKLEFDAQNQALLATGNAKLLSGDTTVVGHRLKMNMRESTGDMEGASFFMLNTFSNLPNFSGAKATDVLSKNYTDPNALSVGSSVSSNASMSSSSAKVNIEDSSDNLAPIAKKSGFSRGDAKMVYFEGEDKKRLKNARYTTCAADSDAWYMKAGEIKLDDYSKTATATNAIVDFKGVPILYSPWIKFSYLNQRKSGFLAPVWGTTVLLEYFA
jgi:LPS-assembly protein